MRTKREIGSNTKIAPDTRESILINLDKSIHYAYWESIFYSYANCYDPVKKNTTFRPMAGS